MAKKYNAKKRIKICQDLEEFLDTNKVSQIQFAGRIGISSASVNNYVNMVGLPSNPTCEKIRDAMDTWKQVADVVEPVIAEQLNQELWVAVQSLNETIKRAEQLNLLLEITANTLQEETIKLSENLDRSEAKTYLSAV